MIDEQPTEPQPAEEPRKRRGSFWRELPILLAVAVVVAIVVRTFLLQTFFIPSGSMEYTLVRDDRVLVNKVIYHFRSPERGEIVVFDVPERWGGPRAGDVYIKRIIAVGGDHLVCCDDQERLVVNGEPLDEPYVYTRDGVSDPVAATEFDVVVPEGRLWMMGDHRSASGDSLDQFRRSGQDPQAATISEDAVIGRAFVLFWPFDRATWLSVPDTYDALPDGQEG